MCMRSHIVVENREQIANLKCTIFFLARDCEMQGVVQSGRADNVEVDVQGEDADMLRFQKALSQLSAHVTLEDMPPKQQYRTLLIG